MSEFTLDDGRKAEKLEVNPDALTKITEVYVEPKSQKKLSQRVIERLCVCEREVQTIDEVTGNVISSEVQKLCEQPVAQAVDTKSIRAIVEEKISKTKTSSYVFMGIIAVQLAVLTYVLFCM